VRQFGVHEEVGGRWIYADGMARSLRNFEAGIYHVAAHGSDTRLLFLCDPDRTDFLERLGYTLWQRGIDLLAYVLMVTTTTRSSRSRTRACRTRCSGCTPSTRASTTAPTGEAPISSAPTASRAGSKMTTTSSPPTATSYATQSSADSLTTRSIGPGQRPRPRRHRAGTNPAQLRSAPRRARRQPALARTLPRADPSPDWRNPQEPGPPAAAPPLPPSPPASASSVGTAIHNRT
jgi:hypothetical protein